MRKIFTLLFLFTNNIVAYCQSSTVVISQVYSGGGSSSATVTYKNDYVELHNVSAVTQDISGFSLQYGSATGNFGNTSSLIYAFPALTSIPAGAYFLIQLGAAGTGGADLPVTADLVTTNLSMGAAAGKVALVNNAVALGCGATATACTLPSVNIIDLVAWGTSNNAEGGAAVAALSITTGAVRKLSGCQDTDNNTADFDVITAPVPRNSASSILICGATGPLLSASPNITGLSTTAGVASAPQNFTLSGTNLTGFPGNISVNASANFEVSLTSGSGYATSVNVSYSSATLTATLVYVRISATAPLGTVSGTVTSIGGGSANAVINASGNVLDAEPGIQANNISLFNILNNSMEINWSNGNGASRLVVIRPTTAPEVVPTDGTIYTANTNIGIAGTTGGGNFVVFSGAGNGPITVTGLTAGTNYTVRVYEFNGSVGSNNYNITTAANNPNNATTTGVSPLLQQINFNSNANGLAPRFMASGTNTRVPTMFAAIVGNLLPNTTYRYYTQASIASDLGTATTGAGNSILIDYTVSPLTYTYTSSPSITSAGGYGKFTTNSVGTFYGVFGFVHTGNARFVAGSAILPSIALAVDGATNIEYRFALDLSITVLQYGTTSDPNDGTFIKGNSLSASGRIVALFPNHPTILFTRPLSMTLVEEPAIISGNGSPVWGTSFITGYDNTTGSWNTIIPNNNPTGVRLVYAFDPGFPFAVNGRCTSDADGTWPSGTVTANPTGGATTPLLLTSSDAPITGIGGCFIIIPVKLSSFEIQKLNSTVKLNWTTEQEINSKEFIVERSTNGTTWLPLANIPATGNSSIKINYTTTDNNPVKGINFYRLRQVDLDGKLDYSATKSVLFNAAYEILVTPNPATGFVNIYLDKNNNRPVNIQLLDVSGKIIRNIIADQPHVRLNTVGIARGLYFIKVFDEGNVTVSKVLLQ